MSIDDLRAIVALACTEFGVRRLDVFGSMARGEETPASDVDLLVEFDDRPRNLARRYFGLLHFLEDTLGRDIDLVTVESLRNPYVRKRVLQERVPIYEG